MPHNVSPDLIQQGAALVSAHEVQVLSTKHTTSCNSMGLTAWLVCPHAASTASRVKMNVQCTSQSAATAISVTPFSNFD